MSFTYDLSTITGQMRMLLGDSSAASPNFSDEELSTCYSLTAAQMSGPAVSVPHGAPSDVLFYACAQAVDVLASRVANSADGKSYQMGDYKITGKDQVDSLQAIAQRFRDAVDNMPAWGIVEENVCDFNQLSIIRNWVLRTEV